MAKRSPNKKPGGKRTSPKIISAQLLPFAFNRDWLWGLILLLAVILVYQPVWYGGFIWDDDSHVTANPCIVGPLGFKDIWTTSDFPLVLSTFWLEHALWGVEPLPYHLVNVLQQGSCVILLWQVLRSLQIPGAWLGAALWALHPVEVESVAWISEMKNTQSGLFFLLSIFFFVKWQRESDGRMTGDWNYALTLLFAAMAMASKTSTVILPIVLCLCAWWMEGRWHWRNLTRVAPILLMAIVASVLSTLRQGQLLTTVTAQQEIRTWPERLVVAGDVVWFYLGKLFWPQPLIPIYSRWEIDASKWVSWLPLLGVLIVILVLWIYRGSWGRPYFFTFAYFLAALLPVLGFVDQPFWNYSFVADHFQYLASMGPLALVGAGLVRVADFTIPGRRWLQASLGAGLLLVLGAMSWRQTWIYESQRTLWTYTAQHNSKAWAAYNQLGMLEKDSGQLDKAIQQFETALAINSQVTGVHFNLANCLALENRFPEAIDQYQLALKISPNVPDLHYNLGVTLTLVGHDAEAIEQFQQALQLKPDYLEARYYLAKTFLKEEKVPNAMDQFAAMLKIPGNNSEAYFKAGLLLYQSQHLPEAIEQFRQALQINPNYAEAHNDLGIALAQSGQTADAISEFQQAIELKPDYAMARRNLDRMQAGQGNH